MQDAETKAGSGDEDDLRSTRPYQSTHATLLCRVLDV